MQTLPQSSTAAATPGTHNSSTSIAVKYLNWRQRISNCKHAKYSSSAASSSSNRSVRYKQLQQWHHNTAAAAASVQISTTSSPQNQVEPHPHQQQNQQQQTSVIPAVGAELSVVCDRLGTEGLGVCHAVDPHSSFVLLIRGALPGEQLVAKIMAVKKGYAQGIKLLTLAPHHNAVPAPCQHFSSCGGCTLQTLSYQAQLNHKLDHVTQLFTRVGKLNPDDVAVARLNPIAAAEGQRLGYRNKIQLGFSSRVWQEDTAAGSSCGKGAVVDGWGLGYYVPGSNTVVMPVQYCHLVGAEANEVIAAVKSSCQQHGLQPYNPATGQGQLRHLIIRTAAAAAGGGGGSSRGPAARSGGAGDVHSSSSSRKATPGIQIMAVIVTTEACRSSQIQPVADQIMQQCRNIGLVSVVHSTEAAAASLPAAADNNPVHGSTMPNIASGSRTRSSSKVSKSRQKGRANLSTISSSSNSSSKRTARGAQALTVSSTKVLAGVPHLTVQLCGLSFHISPHSFFQTNTKQAELLYGQVVAAVKDYYQAAAAVRPGGVGGHQNTGVVLDLYTGTGTIALSLAASNCCRQVTGFDVSKSAIEDAQRNAARNGITNVKFICGDLNQLAKGDLLGPTAQPDLVVVDPARAGLGRSVVEYILKCGAKRIIYVSCNAATQARDLQLLCGEGNERRFGITSWVILDMYPQTGVEHVETVVVLDRYAVNNNLRDS